VGGSPDVEEGGMNDPCRATFADLDAVVYLDGAPRELLNELPELYSSAFSVADYFAIYDRPPRLYVCELDAPRHVIVFTARGATVDVLNKVIDIEPADVARMAAAIFRARPETRRIRAETKFVPAELGLPTRTLYKADDQVIDLPSSQAEWEGRLGASTRANLRRCRNRLLRLHPDFALRVVRGEELTLELVEQVFAWNRQRMRDKGEAWIYESDPAAPYLLWRLLQAHGGALTGSIGGECVAANLFLLVGRDCWAHTAACDPGYLKLRMGVLMTSFLIVEAIERGCARIHLQWGTAGYKQDLGAVPVAAYRLAIYQSRLDRALYARERWSLLKRDRRDIYWRVRRDVKRRVLETLPAGRTEHAERERTAA
jgi:hypothetical protein